MSQTNESCTRFAKLLGIEVPFLNAPMEGIATPELVAAVSEAGGLGVIPAAGLAPDEIRAFAARVKELTQKPFAVNLAVPVDAPADAAERFERFGDAVSMLLEELELPAGEGASYAERYDLEGCTRPDFFEQFDAALEVRPAAVISSFGGFRESEEEKLAELGIVNIGTATTLREAKVLRAAGCGAVIVQGAEAAGPRLSFEDPEDALVGLMSLVPAAVRATGLPVIAAGGIASAEQVNALLAMGAAGVSVGTALLTTAESSACDAHRYYAEFGTACDTVLTRIYNGRLSRVLRNALVEALDDWELMTAGYPAQKALMGPLDRCASEVGRNDLVMLPLGQSAGRSAYRRTADCVHALFPRRAD